MLDINQAAAKLIIDAIADEEITKDLNVEELLEVPQRKEMGDLAFPCFRLSKTFRKAPPMIAQEIGDKIELSSDFEKFEVVGGYINFFANKAAFMNGVIKGVQEKGEMYGSEDVGQGKTICIDYSAPNIAKPFHVGHLFTTVIGNSLYKTFKFMGYNVVGINHLGDWGTQFGKLIVAYKKWGDEKELNDRKVKYLVELYVKFHEEADKDDSLNDEARGWFTKLENGNQEAYALWKNFVELSLEEFNKVYKLLGIEFDSYAGESFYNDKMQPIIDELEEKGLLVESEGAKVVNLDEYDMPPCLLLKKDGSTLYATRDIAAGFYRKANYDFEKCLYVIGGSQALHVKQWTKVVELMGYDWAKDCIHIPFGMVSIEGERLATRKGVIVLLEDLLNGAIEKVLKVIKEKNPDMPNKEKTAEEIGVGAIVFGYLYANRNKDISFKWEDALKFDGETGPYVQYTHARTCSLIQKSGRQLGDKFEYDMNLCSTKEEYELVKLISQFTDKIKQMMNAYEPSVISRYIVEVSQAFNRFYHECSILNEKEELMNSRLALVDATRITLRNGLMLIGLKAPERV